MPENKKWIFFSLFVWLHLTFSLYPIPFQRAEQIHQDAKEAVEITRSNLEAGFKPDKYSTLTVEQWETNLTINYWYYWIVALFFLMGGFVSTYLLYKKSNKWPVFMITTALICLIYNLYPYSKAGPLIEEYLNLIKVVLEYSHYKIFYFSTVFDLYLIILIGFSIYEVLKMRERL